MRFVDLLDIHAIYEAHMNSALNRSSAIRRFKHSNAIERHDGITYTGLPHVHLFTADARCSKTCNICVLVNF